MVDSFLIIVLLIDLYIEWETEEISNLIAIHKNPFYSYTFAYCPKIINCYKLFLFFPNSLGFPFFKYFSKTHKLLVCKVYETAFRFYHFILLFLKIHTYISFIWFMRFYPVITATNTSRVLIFYARWCNKL